MSKIIRLITIVAFLFSFFISYSQDKTIDSLKIVFQNSKIHDTTKLHVISTVMGEKYSLNEPNYYYLNTMLEKLAIKNYRKKNSPELHKIYAAMLAESYSSAAMGEERKRNFTKAFAYIDKSIALYKEAESYENMNFAIVTKGTLYSDIQEYEKAIACLFAPLKYFESAKGENSANGVCYVQTYFGQIYLKQGKFENSIASYQKANRYYDKLPAMTAQDKHARSYVYGNLGKCYFALKKYPEAINSYNQAIALAKSIGDQVTIDVILGKIACVKIEQLKFDEAEQILKQTLKSDFHPVATTGNYINLGELHYKKKEYDQADVYLSKAITLAKEHNLFELQQSASDLLYKVSAANKDYKKALEMYVLHDQLLDSSKTETSKNALIQQQLKYDFEKKEFNLKIDAEKKTAAKNNWLIGLSFLLLLFLLGGYFYYRNNRQKQAITVLEKNQIKQKLLITQMNPHFIFNSVQNIRSLINNNQNEQAVDYLGKFSKLTRQILENSNENYISLDEEVEMIENYLSIQQLLYENKFKFTVDVEEGIDKESIFLPPMLAQPFIENAIKHGLSNTFKDGKIAVHFYLKENKLFFEVTDNGKGFDTDKKVSNHKSLAMTITKERLVSYTKNKDFVVQTDNLFNPEGIVEGAKVVFEIPYIYEK
ncbi:tetratricopeptide repeat-containing sensor histidine kinase [Flavobacterium sp. UBA7682]|uniref:tetratricopeptide repeat-containing sensor histidine kinase n=1 Tax=Flavobacterium sp. UBA7682 TaxID=1946560 RepID=UPI0025C5622B|nr:histidine kinase [Flavobacterium sp. UBA7682]